MHQKLIFVTSNSFDFDFDFDFDIIFLRINHVFLFISGKTKIHYYDGTIFHT